MLHRVIQIHRHTRARYSATAVMQGGGIVKAWPAISLGCLMLAACAPSSAVLVGRTRSPLSSSQVTVYLSPPPAFEDIAMLNASRKTLGLFDGERVADKIIERFKEQAARLGANGVLLVDISDDEITSLGTGVGSQTVTHNADISLGIGGVFSIVKKIGKGRAIYVPPTREP